MGRGVTGAGRSSEPAPPVPVVAGSVGVLGGTFDPIHHGHLALAEAAREALGLERVLFVPTGEPPHKPGHPVASSAHRVAMVQAAIAGNAAFELSRIEVDRPGRSYSADTMALLAERERAAGREPDLWFLLSAEAFRELDTWHEPARLLDACRLAVLPRPGSVTPSGAWVEERFPGRSDRIRFIDGPSIRLSASEIRAFAAAGRSIRYLVPAVVAAYIGDHALYTSEAWRKS